MFGDPAGGREGDVFAMSRDMGERPPEMADAERLADNIGVQGKTHHQRLVRRLFKHFIELIDNHIGEIRRAEPPSDNRRTVVQLLWIGHRKNPARPRFQPHDVQDAGLIDDGLDEGMAFLRVESAAQSTGARAVMSGTGPASH